MCSNLSVSLSLPSIETQTEFKHQFPSFTRNVSFGDVVIDASNAVWDALQVFDDTVIIDVRDLPSDTSSSDLRTVQRFGGVVIGTPTTQTTIDDNLFVVREPVYLSVVYAYALQLYRKQRSVADAVLDDDLAKSNRLREEYKSSVRDFLNQFESNEWGRSETISVPYNISTVYHLSLQESDAGFEV